MLNSLVPLNISKESIATWLLDGHLLIANLRDRTIRIYNEAAAGLWLLLLDGPCYAESLTSLYAGLFNIDASTASRDVGMLLNEWQNLGFSSKGKDGRVRLNAESHSTDSKDVGGVPAARISLRNVIFTSVFKLDKFSFRIKISTLRDTEPPPEAMRLVAMLQGLPACSGPPQADLEVVFGGTCVYLDDCVSPISSFADRTEAFGEVLSKIFELAYPDRRLLAGIHAASVGLGMALIMPGVSGAGKSTLSAYLANRGWNFYGDDVVAVDDQSRVAPLPMAASLKDGSHGVLSAAYPTLSQIRPLDYGAKAPKYMALPYSIDSSDSLKLAGFVFPNFLSGAPTELRSILGVDALKRLIEARVSLNKNINLEGIGRFLNIINDVPKYALVYSNMVEAETCLRSIVPN